MTASKVDDLAKVQALLAECGLEKTAAVLLDEAPQISKTNAKVQAFLESTTSQGSGKRPRSSGSDSSSDSSSSSSSSSSSDSESSSSSDSDSSSSSSSSSDSSSSSESDSSSSSDSDSSSSASSSSDSDSDSSSSSSSDSDSDSDSDTKGETASKTPAKKRRLSLETPVKPKTQTTAPVPQTAPAKAASKDGRFAKRGEAGNAPNTPFCRIRPEDVVYADERLKDNTYISKGGFENDFGYKAHMDLIVTRGKGFTKEKNKKKRGSYSGGKITMQSHSIKFD
ncbi:jun-like transcription factor [Coemansia sp. RSA 455]|nr:jun-like transcription factor [Coemansia sp. RSA 455]